MSEQIQSGKLFVSEVAELLKFDGTLCHDYAIVAKITKMSLTDIIVMCEELKERK